MGGEVKENLLTFPILSCPLSRSSVVSHEGVVPPTSLECGYFGVLGVTALTRGRTLNPLLFHAGQGGGGGSWGGAAGGPGPRLS